MGKKLNSRCLFCEGDLTIASLNCRDCGTKIESELPIPRYFRLGEELQAFVLVFLRCRGNIREVEKELGISYPTVCKRLDRVNELLANTVPAPSEPKADGDSKTLNARRQQILEDLEQGKVGAADAAQLLRELRETSE